MLDKEKFEGFKERSIDENEEKYGAEIRAKYGDKAINNSNQKLKGMSEEKFKEITKLQDDYMEALKAGFKTGNPAGELAQRAADLHGQWLSFYWDSYTKEAHANLSQIYVDDERFRMNYDKEQPGMAAFFREAILIYTGVGEE